MPSSHILDWLLSPENPATQYLTARDLVRPRPSARELKALHAKMLAWEPLGQILSLQRDDGSFPAKQKGSPETTYIALRLMSRCGMGAKDDHVSRAVGYLRARHLGNGAFSHNTGGSGILPCYVGLYSMDLSAMLGVEAPCVTSSLKWIVDHQRFDHRRTRGGGDQKWPYRVVDNYGGCWHSVSCYHGVVATLGALAAVPPASRTRAQAARVQAALRYLAIHRGLKKSSEDKPLFRHLTQFFLFGGYRSHLIDVLDAVANADSTLAQTEWVREAISVVDEHAVDGKIILAKNYPTNLVDPLPFERIGQPSRFLSYQWLRVKQRFGLPVN